MNDAKTSHPLHTLYSKGVLSVEGGHLPKTKIPWVSSLSYIKDTQLGTVAIDVPGGNQICKIQ